MEGMMVHVMVMPYIVNMILIGLSLDRCDARMMTRHYSESMLHESVVSMRSVICV